MGASQSQIKSATEIVKEVSTEVMKSSSAKCAANTAVSQNISLRNIELGKGCAMEIENINQKADVAVNLDCKQVQESMTDIQNNFNTAIDNKFKADAEAGVGIANASIDIRNKIKETIKTKINLKQLAECVTDLKASQNFDIGFKMGDCAPPPNNKVKISNINQTLFAQNTAKCVQEQFDKYSQTNTSGTEISNEGETSAKGMDMGALIIYIIIGLIALAVVGAFVKFVLLKPPSPQQFFPPPQQFFPPQQQFFPPQQQNFSPPGRFNDGLKYF
jgi:hypothetical protein